MSRFELITDSVPDRSCVARGHASYSTAAPSSVTEANLLRLRLATKHFWTDSKGLARSPLQEFSILSEDARSRLAADGRSDLIPWEFGVVTDDWAALESSKPVRVGDGGPDTCYAGGSERASDLHEDLLPLWKQFLAWLLPPTPVALLISDEMWHPRGQWVSIGDALREGLLSGLTLSAQPTEQARLYTMCADRRQRELFMERWWPSPLGILLRSCVPGADRSICGRIRCAQSISRARRSRISRDLLPHC